VPRYKQPHVEVECRNRCRMDTRKPARGSASAPAACADNSAREMDAANTDLAELRRMLLRRVEVLEAAIARLKELERTQDL